jgi:hypothetical protein
MSKEEKDVYAVISVKLSMKERFNQLKEELVLAKKISVNSTDTDAMKYILDCLEAQA